jgi:hypothetical protein
MQVECCHQAFSFDRENDCRQGENASGHAERNIASGTPIDIIVASRMSERYVR